MPPSCSVEATEKTISRLEIYAVRSGNSCRSLRNDHAAVSGIDVQSERNLHLYSPKAKAKLNYYYKLYNEDVSMNSIRVSGTRYDLTHNLENIVLNELLFMGYEVTVYDNKGREIDFRAEKEGKTYLMLVCARINGKWDLTEFNRRSVSVTVK